MWKAVLLFLLLPLALQAQKLKLTQPVRFLALGDSYTIGESVAENERWPNQLRDSLKRRNINVETVRIIATTGWRTDNLINAIRNQNLVKENYNLVSILIGINNQYQGRDISQYEKEFEQLLDSAIRYAGGDTNNVFIVSIPDYAYTPFGQQSPDAAQISMELDEYNDMSKEFAKKYNIKYFDITPISRQGINDPSLVAKDGLHPSGKQYTEWVNLILQHIDSNLTTGIEELKNGTQINIYPNPANRFLRIENIASGADIYIYDIYGKLIRQDFVSQRTHLEIDLNNIKPGFYTMRISTQNNEYISRKLYITE